MTTSLLLALVISLPAVWGTVASASAVPAPDTNIYAAPPSATGGVGYDARAGTYTQYPGDILYGVYDSRYYSSHGYASFTLSGRPESASVVSAQLRYFQYDCGSLGGGTPYTGITLIPSTGGSAQQLFDNIANGTVASPGMTTPNGWVVRELNQAGINAVDSCWQRQQVICFGVAAGGSPEGVAYGRGEFRPDRAQLAVRYATSATYSDIVAVGSDVFPSPAVVGSPMSFPCTFSNTGNGTASNFRVVASIDGTPADTVAVDSLGAGETTAVVLTIPARSVPAFVTLRAAALLAGDWCTHNDSIRRGEMVFPAGTTSAEGFEQEQSSAFPPPGWVIQNDGDSATWQRNSARAERDAHSGGFYAFCPDADVCEDWLITPGLCPSQERTDSIGFFFRPHEYYSELLQVWALSQPDRFYAFDLLFDTLIAAPASWAPAQISLDRFDGQTIYVGFRKYCSDRGGVRLDDIWFTSDLLPGVTEDQVRPAPALLGVMPTVVVSNRAMASFAPAVVHRRMRLYDALGRSTRDMVVAPGIGCAWLDLAGMPAGTYTVVLYGRDNLVAAMRSVVVVR